MLNPGPGPGSERTKRWNSKMPCSLTPSCLPHLSLHRSPPQWSLLNLPQTVTPPLFFSSLYPHLICNTHHYAWQLLTLLGISTTKSNTLSILIPLYFPSTVPVAPSSGWQVTLVRWLWLSSGKASWRKGHLDWILSMGKSAGRDGRNSMGKGVEIVSHGLTVFRSDWGTDRGEAIWTIQ